MCWGSYFWTSSSPLDKLSDCGLRSMLIHFVIIDSCRQRGMINYSGSHVASANSCRISWPRIPRRTVYTQYLPFAQLLLDTPFRTTLRGNAKTPPMQGPGRLFSAFEYQGLVILVPLCNWVTWTWSSWELALQVSV